MPRKARISSQNALRILMKYSVEFQSGELPKYSHPVWKNLEKENDAWSSHNWYNKLKKNSQGLWTQFLQEMVVAVMRNETLQSTLDSSIEENNNTIFIIDRDDKVSESWFDCYLQQEEWALFNGFTMANLNDEIRCKLSPDTWETILDTRFWKQNRLPCVFSFIGAEINTSAKIFLKIASHCKSNDCDNEFYGYSDVKPSPNNDELHIHVRTSDTRKIEHEDMHPALDQNRKRRLEKETIHHDCVKRTTKMCKRAVSPSICHNSASARKEELDNHEKKNCTQDPITRIYAMQFDQDSFGSIHDISYLPFYTQYGLSVQTIIYKTYSQSTRSSTISIGRVINCCKELARPKGLQSSDISLYAIVVELDATVFSVYQMLAESDGTEVLEFWIKRWMRRVNSRPKQVITPYSLSILSACAEGFNNVTIERYIQNIVQALMRSEELPRDLTMIRIDPAELAQIILGWSCMQSVDSHDVRRFYMKSIAVLVTCRSFAEFTKLFSLVCAVACQNYDDSILQLENVSTTCDARGKLQDLFLTKESYMKDYWEIAENYMTPKDSPLSVQDPVPEAEIFLCRLVQKLRMGDYITETDVNYHDSKPQVIETFILNLITPALLAAQTGTQLNAYFLPAIVIELFRLGKQFPIWAAVSIPVSCLNQSKNHARFYVENCKRKFAESRDHPTEVDGFLRFHLQDLSGNEEKIPLTRSPCGKEDFGEKLMCKEKVDKPFESLDSIHDSHIVKNSIDPIITEGKLDSGSMFTSIPPEYSQSSTPPPSESKFCGSSSPHQSVEVPLETSSRLASEIPMFDADYRGKHGKENTNVEDKKLYDLVYGQRSKGKFFKDVPEIHVINALDSRATNVFFLRNGNVSPAVVVDGRKFEVTNTCAFDSISRILIASALDFPDYRSFVKDSEDQLMKFVNLFLTKATKTQIWQERIRILSPHYKWTETRTNCRLILTGFSAFDNLTQVWKYSITSEPSALSVLECQNCDSPLTPLGALSVNHRIIGREGFKALGKALGFHSLLFNIRCQKCKVGVISRTIPNRTLFIELDVRMGPNNNITKKGQLDDFPDEISLEMKEVALNNTIIISELKYRLAGVIDLTGHHYTAYCKRLSGNWELYNDLLVKTHTCRGNKWINPHGAIYILKADEKTN